MKTAFNSYLLELAKIWYIFLLVGKNWAPRTSSFHFLSDDMEQKS